LLITEMSNQECRDLLARSGSGRLACSRENQPYIVPVYFVYEPDHLYGFATLGRKIEWMRLNPRVCVEADEVQSHFEWRSVVVLGRYEEFPDISEYRDARAQALALLEKRFLWWQTAYGASQTRGSTGHAVPVLYCIHIEEITGHRASPDTVETAAGFIRPRP
jgi:uncharacterized protein